jgi:HEAT repeat protein
MILGVAVVLCSCQRAKRDESTAQLIDDLEHGRKFREQAAAARTLGERKTVQAVLPLIAALSDAEPDPVRTSAARALGNIKDPRAIEPLITLLREGSPLVREASAHALGDLKDPKAVGPLITALKKGCQEAGPALAQIGERAVAPLIECLQDADTRRTAKDALVTIGKPAVGPLIEAFRQARGDVRLAADYARLTAAGALAEIDDPRAADTLAAALSDGDLGLAAAIYKFLIRAALPGSENLLRDTLRAYGTSTMAQDFYDSGRPALKAMAQLWANENSYPLQTTSVMSPKRSGPSHVP